MTPERFASVMEVLADALELAPDARGAFLDAACGGDGALRAEVESLLAAGSGAGAAGSDPLAGDALDFAAALLGPPARGTLAGHRLGAYRLERLLGAGGMGEVYLAHDERLDRKVALKLLAETLGADPRWRRRFLREARLASALDHPNVCTIHEVGETEGRAWIAMQLVEGRTVRELVGGRPLPPEEWVPLALQVAEALAAAHERGIVHRDVKATNVVVTPRGQAKVLDFGIARRLDEPLESLGAPVAAGTGREDFDVTAVGTVLGTPASMAPEQASGARADERSDVFSLGVLLYEMATGRVPFAGDSRTAVLGAVIESTPPPASEVHRALPAALSEVIDSALAKDPARRTQSMAELIAGLRAAASAVHLEHERGAGSATTRRRWIAGLAGTALVATVAIVAALTSRRDAPPAESTEAAAPPFQSMRMTRLTTAGTASSASISPDGATIAYALGEAVAAGYQPRWPAGRTSLWVEETSTGTAVQIAPPRDVRYDGTTFSPDGRLVYFSATDREHPLGALYRVPAAGGSARLLVERIQSPAAISPDGRHLAFVRHDPTAGGDALVVGDAEGGNERVLLVRTGVDWIEEDGISWSPDGEHIVIGVGTDRGGTHMSVVAVPARGGEPRALAAKRWSAVGRVAWSGDGRAVVVIGSDEDDPGNVGTSAQVWRIDLPSGAVGRITNDLSGYGHRSLALTGDGRSLVAVQEDVTARIWEVELDLAFRPSSARQRTTGKFDARSGLDWTSNGALVYGTRGSDHEDLWVLEAEGSTPRRLTDDAAIEEAPAVSPDGREVVFSSTRSGSRQLWVMPVKGGAAKPLTADLAPAAEPGWFPDGRWVAFSSWRSGSLAIWRVPAAGGPAVAVVEAPSFRPAVSPDGTLVACSWFDHAALDPRWRLAVLAVKGGEPREVLALSHETVNPLAGLAWTPDGRSLLYVDTPRGVSNVWRLPLGGGAPRQITTFDSGQIFAFALSRDGRRLAVSRGGIEGDVVLIRDSR